MMTQKYLPVCVFLILLSSSAFAQRVDTKRLSRLRVSGDLRARLAERLNSFIEYELSEQYGKQYDLLALRCPTGYGCAVISREEYVKEKRQTREGYGKLLELKFVGIDGRLREGCASPDLIPKFRKGKFVYINASSTIACLQNGEWYFRFWLVEI
jgi:hypothetical protein